MMQITVNELKILLTLNGGQRLPYLEDEIFANDILTRIYVRLLCENYIWYSGRQNYMLKLICLYAKFVIKEQWQAAEHLILESPEYSFHYARMVINDTWPEAEPCIIKSPKYAVYYARALAGRWLEAEPYIMQDTAWWVQYTDYFGITPENPAGGWLSQRHEKS